MRTTQFMIQKKKPRFIQRKHISQDQFNEDGTPAPTKRKLNKRPPQPWDTGKSIEELEASMAKKWGVFDKKEMNRIPEGYQAAVEDGNDVQSEQVQPQISKRRRPVSDPWEKKEKNGRRKEGDKPYFVREYYDEDDVGFEYIDEDDDIDEDDEDDKPRSILNVKHLIAPKPAGGRGTSSSSNTNSGGGYFFNPNATRDGKAEPSAAATNHDRQRKIKQENKSIDTGAAVIPSKKEGRVPRAPAALPLLDEDGDPRLLTVAEALRQFQETVDEGTMKIIETAEVPIVACTQSQSWEDLGITSKTLLENLDFMNCPTPLAVQEKTTPAILTGNDVLVGTYTGSGKTLAFLAPLIQRLLWSVENDVIGSMDIGLAVLIVAPGRELASQIVSVARDLLQDTGLTAQLAIGGTTFSRNLEQIRKRKPNILVGTPGRIAELVVGKPGEKSGKLKIGSLQTLVMDEFDALLEYKPHRDPTRAIMGTLKRRHGNTLQSVLCSATATDVMNSNKVIDFLRPGYETAMADDDDVLVTGVNKVDEETKLSAPQVSRTVLHGVVHLEHRRFALEAVRRILHTEPVPQQILIFVENARKVDIVVEKLEERGIIAAPLHGGTGSEKMDRAEVSKALREGYVGIVVATEMAARGLDAPLLTHVINMDLPTDASHYAHRAGRCGRGGRPGVVINLTTSPKEHNVPKRFADQLGVDMYTVEPRSGQLLMVDPDTQTLDY
ncbi:RNA helicase [Nitzschia inconspicua]|uniref:RNA helicase n=1 Tax=Nitzschia inconspicua TaxID=303405 RepID=A0A9K3Q8U6_9STRA|nr:RNA helicase [Nitzschia inconspicua]